MMRLRRTRRIQLVLVGLFVGLYVIGDIYNASSPLYHIPWLFPVARILCAAAIILIDKANKCPYCRKDLGYQVKDRCPHCGELLP